MNAKRARTDLPRAGEASAEEIFEILRHAKVESDICDFRYFWECDQDQTQDPGRPDRPRLPPAQRKALADGLLAELAGLCGAGDDQTLRVGLDITLDWAWWRSNPAPQSKFRRAVQDLQRVKRLSSQLSECLQAGLDPRAQREMLLAIRTATVDVSAGPSPWSPREELERRIAGLDVLSSAASSSERTIRFLEKRRREHHHQERRNGRPKGLRNNNFAQFALRVLWDVRQSGGKLTVEKNERDASGSLPPFLDALRPYTPPGFIPIVLPLPTLALVRSLDKKVAAVLG